MNFKAMPELKWPLGYLFAWMMIMLFTGLVYAWLKRQKRLEKQRKKKK